MSHDDVHPDAMPDDLDAFFDDLRAAAADVPAPVVGHALTTLFREGTAPVAAPTPRRRHGVRVAVAGAVAGLTFGGLGVAGALPAPIQQRVADVVDHVGVHLPDGTPGPTTTTSTTTSSTTTTSARPTTPRTEQTPATERGRSDDAPGRTGEEPGHGGEVPGRSGEDHGSERSGRGKSTEAPARTTPTTAQARQDDGSGKGRGDDSENPAARRNPTDADGVHLVDEPDLSAPTNRGGRSECAPTCSLR